MIKDIVVNLGLGERDPAGEYAIAVADAFGAHVLGMAIIYDPVIPGTVMGGIPPAYIETQRVEAEKMVKAAIARFETTAKRVGVSFESRSVNASVAGAAERLGRLGRRSIWSSSASPTAINRRRWKWWTKACSSNPAVR